MTQESHLNRSATLLYGLLALLLVALAGCGGADAGSASDIQPEELAQRISDGNAPVILDVRSPEEFAAGHIPGAVNIPHKQVLDRLSELPADRSAEIVIHCQRGPRARRAESALREAGFSGLRHLDGHFAGWEKGGLPVVR